ncbi:MAG: fumarylacetoacetate hydrolase family protein [bacterium]|nr:fumarylacetoacetate hydrolase family protein [bacterium]
MRLVSYVKNGQHRAGLVCEDMIVDLTRASQGESVRRKHGRPLPPSVKRILELGEEALAVVSLIESEFAGHVPEDLPPDFCLPLHQAKLVAPVPDPQKIICIGMNYRDHCEEQKKPLPEKPIIFAKFPTALIGHNQPIVKPALTEKMDYEAELGVVIGKRGKNIPEKQALSHVAGYTIVNDVTARDIQVSDGQWVRAKSFDTFAPSGPFLVTADEAPDPQNMDIRLAVNGEVRQSSNTRNMVFSVAYLISYISRVCTLLPGDLISTGTPGGVGVFRDPPVFLKEGDVISIEIERLGVLTNPVREEHTAT